jgi:hypothetical protein
MAKKQKFWIIYAYPDLTPATSAWVEGSTRDEVLKAAQAKAPVRSYISSVSEPEDRTIIWNFDNKWLAEADKHLPR